MKITKFLLGLNLFFLQSYLVRFSIGKIPTNLQEILIFLLILSFVVEILREKRLAKIIENISRHWVLISFVLLTGFSVLMVRFAYNVDFVRALRFLLCALVVTFIFVEVFLTDAERRKALYIAGHGAMFFGIFSVVYNLFGLNVAYDYRLQGPLDSAVYLAYYLTPFFIFFLTEFFNNPRKKQNLYHSILLAGLIFLTRSVGSVVVSVVVILLYFFKRSDLKIFRSARFKAIAVVVLLAVFGVAFYVKVLPTFQTNNTSLGERDEIWATSMYLLKDPKNLLLGVGFGQFQTQYAAKVDSVLGHKPLDYNILQPHNIFLLFIFQYGLVGLFFLLFCMYKAVSNFSRINNKDEVRLTFTLMLFYFFLHGLIDTPFFKNDLLILFILILELAEGELFISQNKQKHA